LYEQSRFTYADQVEYLTRTYSKYLGKAAAGMRHTDSLLEIGCGNGFLLDAARRDGWKSVSGVEPSRDAIEKAPREVRENIVCDVMRPGLFQPMSFDLVCLFQVLDHLPDPASVLAECFRVLRPGGRVLCLNHNVRAVSARLLGQRSPIIDVEHTYLYSRKTVRLLLEKVGFADVKTGTVVNVYPLQYLAWLLPLPSKLKKGLLSRFDRTPLGRITLPVPLGNLFAVGQKAAS
jgi:SAM-dependent methyltransferase